ncbi:hypothetical protein HYV22_03190 [Candidatus Gottesmanbacteria bacterium]|nr:hypothetical protein [Candidatus Gottesmanbacteria bacterium]
MTNSPEAISCLAQDGENDTPPIISQHFLEAMRHQSDPQYRIIFSHDEVETMRQEGIDPRAARMSLERLTGKPVILIGEES